MGVIEQIISPFQFRNFISLDHLSGPEADFFRDLMVVGHASKGTVLFRQGEQARGMYMLLRGKVKVYQEKHPGQRRLLHVYAAGDMLGHRSLLTDGMHTVTAVALEDCFFQFLPRDAFQSLINQSPVFAHQLLKAVSQEFQAWSNFHLAFDSSPVRARVALALLILHEKYRVPGNTTSVIHFTRTDLSDYVVASLETVVRILREFREAGFVHVYGRRMLITNTDALIGLILPTQLTPSTAIA